MHGSMCPRPGHLKGFFFFLGVFSPPPGTCKVFFFFVEVYSPPPGTQKETIPRSRTYLKDCFWLAGKTIGIVTYQYAYPWKPWKCRLKGTTEIKGLERCRSTEFPTPELLIDLKIRFCYIFFLRTKAKRNVFTTFINVFWVYKLFSKLLRQG